MNLNLLVTDYFYFSGHVFIGCLTDRNISYPVLIDVHKLPITAALVKENQKIALSM